MTRVALILAPMLTAFALLALSSTPADAQVTCGAKITALTTTLTSSDPVTSTVCPGDGIIIGADDITLDCGGLTLKGNKKGAGIKLAAGASGTIIQNCVVDSFNKGLQIGAGGGVFVTNVVSQNNKDAGVEVTSDFSFFSNVLSRSNGGIGFHFSGMGNGGEAVVALQNTMAGFSIGGRAADISSSFSISNGQQGFTGTIKESSIASSSSIANGGDGFSFAGGTLALPNAFGDLKAIANGGNGLSVGGTNPDVNVDNGGNSGLANAGAIQCQIAGQPCQP
jgi:hypothetical protein